MRTDQQSFLLKSLNYKTSKYLKLDNLTGGKIMEVTIVVDYQNDFVNGTLGFKRAEEIDPIIANRLEDAIINGHIIVETKDTHSDDYLDTQEGKKLPIEHTKRGTYGHRTYGKTGEILSNYTNIIEKNTFGSLKLAQLLIDMDTEARRNNDRIHKVYLHGLLSDKCVISNAVMAKSALPEAEVIVDNLTCASNDPKLHEEALDIMESLFITVLNRNK